MASISTRDLTQEQSMQSRTQSQSKPEHSTTKHNLIPRVLPIRATGSLLGLVLGGMGLIGRRGWCFRERI